ncbi:MAG: Anti-sigma-K factor RskA [Candidatus Sulfotelmatobacter sp.]|nr:Anti-sigma-K factor RskA [Candidatus Sulfotelmatobacter sp.]
MSRSPHDEFLELCAISTSGQLTGEEQRRLQKHLVICPSCRQVMREYEAVLSETIPSLVSEREGLQSDPSWSQEQAEAALFERLTMEEQFDTDRGHTWRDSAPKAIRGVPSSVGQTTWRNVWMLCAAGVLLCIALGISAYRVGTQHGAHSARAIPTRDQGDQIAALQQQLSDVGHERELLRSEMGRRDAMMADLRGQLERQSSDLKRAKLAQTQSQIAIESRQAGRQDPLPQRSEVTQQLEAAQAKAQGLQDKLDSLARQSSEDKQLVAGLEAKVTDLTRLLRDREASIDQQEELLAHDRDIRELMGARDLYVAEVYDVERNGKTKKPYGRVFYTKGKSLIFYAYDLDEQKGVKNASTFQAWGTHGTDRKDALNLGLFYVDNSSKKRWVLRFDDPKTLAQIDAVFVTVEPNGGSNKPSNKPLLFAYLHMDPNHP